MRTGNRSALVVGVIAWIGLASAFASARRAAGDTVTVTGDLRVWHPVTLTFVGPSSGEDATPNPFTDYRLEVAFENGSRTMRVPGFFAADGNAAETGAVAGNRWRVHVMPDRPGRWTWRASMRTGSGVAVGTDATAGTPTGFDGLTGELAIEPSDKRAPDFRARGVLRHTGGHYLQFAGDERLFLKGGADSPENFLAYADFDDTTSSDRPRRPGEADRTLHRFAPHVQDWKPGDPTWRGDRGKGIIGALNYLAGMGMNSVYFLTMNVGGDGDDVFPWVSREVRDRFDVSKLDQWEIVFRHMTRLGTVLHVLTQETENETLLDEGELGPLRRLYYRELVARFAHHPGMVWNLGEENGPGHEGQPFNTDAQRAAFARYFKETDPYQHPIVVHTWPGRQGIVYEPLLGNPHFDGVSLQVGNAAEVYQVTRTWRERSAGAGRPWFVPLDEIGPADVGARPDADDPTRDELRRDVLWGNLMAGGAGVEWYFGYKFPHNDLNAEDWRSRHRLWQITRHALDLFEGHVPLASVRPVDGLVRNAESWCLADPGRFYLLYLRAGGTPTLRLAQGGRYTVRWYDPRSGGALQEGPVTSVNGPGDVSLGAPPRDGGRDWAVLVRRDP